MSCRPSRYSKPSRLLTRACSPRVASAVTLRVTKSIQISLLYLMSFSSELHCNVCTKDPTQHFERTGCRRMWSEHRTTGDILLVGESSSRQEPTRSEKVKVCPTHTCTHNRQHTAHNEQHTSHHNTFGTCLVLILVCFWPSHRGLRRFGWDVREVCLRRAKSGKLLRRIVSISTGKSYFKLGYGSERQTEPSHSWFPPTFPSGLLELNSFIR